MKKEMLDRLMWEIMRPMWLLLSLLALYILFLTYKTFTSPVEYLSYYRMIPEMTEHLLAGCIVTAGFGAATEYSFGKGQ